MIKKISFLLFICFLSVLNINAEVISGSCGTNVKYSLDTETGLLSITGTGAMASYGYTGSEPWQSNRSYIKRVEIADGVTKIGSGAFYGCSALIAITIPKSVSSIEDYVFSGCNSLMSVTILSNTLVSKSYGERASLSYIFGNQVKEYIIGEQVTKIGKYAFAHCYSAKSINLPNSVTSIEYGAFKGCSGLESIIISQNVTSIGGSAFEGCSGNLKVNCNIPVYTLYQDCPFAEAKFSSVIIGNDIKTIGDYAFYNNPELTSITFGSSVESLGEYSFNNIKKLEKIYCYAENVPTASRNTFENSYIDYATLYVPASSLDAYKSTAPWKNAANILPLEDIQEKCATPTILFENGKLSFSCETEGAKYVYNFSTPSESDEDGKGINMPNKLQVSVYAKKDGFENSDVATKEIDLGTSAIRGDLNGDGVVSMPDAMYIVNKILNGKFPDEKQLLVISG